MFKRLKPRHLKMNQKTKLRCYKCKKEVDHHKSLCDQIHAIINQMQDDAACPVKNDTKILLLTTNILFTNESEKQTYAIRLSLEGRSQKTLTS